MSFVNVQSNVAFVDTMDPFTCIYRPLLCSYLVSHGQRTPLSEGFTPKVIHQLSLDCPYCVDVYSLQFNVTVCQWLVEGLVFMVYKSIFSTNKTDRSEIIEILLKERFENTKEFIRSHKLKNNTQSYKSTTQKTIEWATSTLQRKKNGNELRCSGRVRISNSTSCTCSVALVKN